MRDVFYMPKNTKCVSHFSDQKNLLHVLFY